MSKHKRTILLGLVAAASLALAGAAGAAEGWGILVGNDGASRLTLKEGVVLVVGEQTRIEDRDGKPLALSDLRPAREFAGGLEVRGEHQLRWSGQRSGQDTVDASRVIVWGEVVR